MKKILMVLDEVLEVTRTLFEESLIEEPEIELMFHNEECRITPNIIVESEEDFQMHLHSEDSEMYQLYRFIQHWEIEKLSEISFEVQEAQHVRNEELNAEVAAVFDRGVGYDATTYLKL